MTNIDLRLWLLFLIDQGSLAIGADPGHAIALHRNGVGLANGEVRR